MDRHLEPGQAVEIRFNEGTPEAFTLTGTILENIDASCKPLRNMWFVKTSGGSQFGISGKALYPVEQR